MMNETERFLLSRRQMITAASAALLISANARQGRTAPNSLGLLPSNPLYFDILDDDETIGFHEVKFDGFGDELLVETRIEMDARFWFFPLLEYSHRSAETWKQDRLTAFASNTFDGYAYASVIGHAVENGFEVTGKKGTALAPSDVMVGSFWNPNIFARKLLINPEKGTLEQRIVNGHDRTTITIAEKPCRVSRYRLSSILDGDVYYDERGRWVGAFFTKKGIDIRYRMRA